MTPSQSNAMAKLKSSPTGWAVWWIWPSAAIVLCLMLATYTFLFGNVSGTELSQQDLTTRTFSYQQIPFLEWQIGAVYHDYPTSPAADLAISQHLKPLGNGEQVEWDLVDFNEGTGYSMQSDAAILEKILEQRDDNRNYFWVNWSTQNPVRAAELWPAIQDLARSNLYIAMPPLMELYSSGATDSSLIPERNELIVQNAKLAIDDAEARNDTDTVAKIRGRLASYDEYGQLKANPTTSKDNTEKSDSITTEPAK